MMFRWLPSLFSVVVIHLDLASPASNSADSPLITAHRRKMRSQNHFFGGNGADEWRMCGEERALSRGSVASPCDAG